MVAQCAIRCYCILSADFNHAFFEGKKMNATLVAGLINDELDERENLLGS